MIRNSLAFLLVFQVFNCFASDSKKKAVILVPVDKSRGLVSRLAKQPHNKHAPAPDLVTFVMSQCSEQLEPRYQAYCAKQRATADALMPGSGKHLMLIDYKAFCAISIRNVIKKNAKTKCVTGILAIDARQNFN